MAEPSPSGLYALNQNRPPERGARIARREERADWASVSDEERGEAGCPARPLGLIQRIQATRLVGDAAPESCEPLVVVEAPVVCVDAPAAALVPNVRDAVALALDAPQL